MGKVLAGFITSELEFLKNFFDELVFNEIKEVCQKLKP